MIISNKVFLFSDSHRFEVVAIASNNVRRIWDVKGKRLCHPGLDTIDDWTKIFSTVGDLLFCISVRLKSCLFLNLSVFREFHN